MARAKTKGVGTNLPVPQTDAEAEQMVAQLGALQRDHAEATVRHDASVAALETEHGKATKAFEDKQTAIIEGLAIWASANRERLTGGGKTKTVQLPTGAILWREGRYAVKHRPLKVDEVVAAIQQRCLEVSERITAARTERNRSEVELLTATLGTLNGFLRPKVELSKEAMLAAREVAETVPGVTVPRGAEEFVVEPLASQIREVA